MATAYGQALGLDSTGLLLALPGDTDRCVPERADLQPPGEKCAAGDHHHHLHRCVFLHRGLCVLAGHPVRLLAAGDPGGHVPGGDPGAVPVYFAKIIPAEKSGEFFGIYDICGKGASVIGTALVSFLSQATEASISA